jgi:hypothetical protein
MLIAFLAICFDPYKGGTISNSFDLSYIFMLL